MRRYPKWVLTLGIVAATPGLAAAAAPNPFGPPQDDAAATAPGHSRNQKVAENVAIALKRANFHGYEIDIEYKDGLATLRGKISDPRQKARASNIVSRVPGVQRVENKLVLISAGRGKIQQVAGSEAEPAADPRSAAIAFNQQKAMEVGRTLQSAGLNGYDIEVMFQNGQVVLRGAVATPEQRGAAARIASSVSGVQNVSNQLQVQDQGQGQGRGPSGPRGNGQFAMAGYQPGPPPVPGGPVAPGGPIGGPMVPPGMMGRPMPPGPGGPAMGAPMPATGPLPNGPAYENANVPEYAWPSYAQYPNYAAVTYPSQYSASAWPYIGPFYPYPQVPLNWRKVSLEWDDGYWNLKFDSQTEKWWWFLSPRNW